MKKPIKTNEELVYEFTVKFREAFHFGMSVLDKDDMSGDLSGQIMAALATHINNLIRQAEYSRVRVKPIMDEVFGKDNTRGKDDSWHYYNQIYWIANLEYGVEWVNDYSQGDEFVIRNEFKRTKKSIRHAINLTVKDSKN